MYTIAVNHLCIFEINGKMQEYEPKKLLQCCMKTITTLRYHVQNNWLGTNEAKVFSHAIITFCTSRFVTKSSIVSRSGASCLCRTLVWR